MTTGHAYLGASASHRWGHCPGSAVLAEGLPNTSSAAAARGTALHAVAELALRNRPSPARPEDVDLVKPYTDWVRSLPGLTWLEQRVYYGKALDVPDDLAFGMADCINLSPDGRILTVGDLKTGGMRVEATDNPQLVLYAVGALDFLDMMGYARPEQVRLAICQPAINDEPLVWECDVFDLFNITDRLARSARIAVSQRGAPLIATLSPHEEACRWCPAAATCPALLMLTQKFAPPKMHVVKATDFKPVQLPGNQLREHYEAVGVLRLWCDAIESEMFSATTRGEKTGYKLVEGRLGNRRYTSPAAVEAALTLQGIPSDLYLTAPELISPAQLDKVIKSYPQVAPLIEPLIERLPGKPTLAPESDTRPAFVEDRAGKMVEKFKSLSP